MHVPQLSFIPLDYGKDLNAVQMEAFNLLSLWSTCKGDEVKFTVNVTHLVFPGFYSLRKRL